MKTGFIGLIVLRFLILIPAAEGPEEDGKLICSHSSNVTVGGEVTLSCQAENQRNVKGESIEWTFNNITIVLLYRNRGFSDLQDKQFKGRAFPGDSWKPEEGNLGLRIHPVKKTDAGRVTCSVGVKKKKISCSTILNVCDTMSELKHIPQTVNRGPKCLADTKAKLLLAAVVYFVFH